MSEHVTPICGHSVVYREGRFVCTRCRTRLLSVMQFYAAECPSRVTSE